MDSYKDELGVVFLMLVSRKQSMQFKTLRDVTSIAGVREHTGITLGNIWKQIWYSVKRNYKLFIILNLEMHAVNNV